MGQTYAPVTAMAMTPPMKFGPKTTFTGQRLFTEGGTLTEGCKSPRRLR